MKVVALDIGRSVVKVVSHNYQDWFESVIGKDYRPLVDFVPGARDIVLEWQGKTYFGGSLAARESEYAVQDSRSLKVHEHTKILAVMAMHRIVQDNDKLLLVTGHPIDGILTERSRMKELLRGDYTATVNGVTKSWTVEQVEVTPEGAIAAWSVDEFPPIVHLFDCASRMPNYAVLLNRGLHNRLSGSLNFGFDTVQNKRYDLFADRVAGELSRRWLSQQGPLFVVGGAAEPMQQELARHFKDVRVLPAPQFASVRGMYVVGVRLLEKAKDAEAR